MFFNRQRELQDIRRALTSRRSEMIIQSKHALYFLSDHFVAFWYRNVDRLRHLLGMRRYDEALQVIQGDFEKYVSERAFEDICRQSIWNLLSRGQLPTALTFDTVGSWWTSEKNGSDEIDVVATSQGHTVLVGECRWSRQPSDRRDLEGLRASLHKATPTLNPIDRPWRALFSRSGFSEELWHIASDPAERVLLFVPNDLYR